MASKMAVSLNPYKTCLTKKLNIKHFNFDFLSMFRSLILQTIKMKHHKDEILKMSSKMAMRHFSISHNFLTYNWPPSWTPS